MTNPGNMYIRPIFQRKYPEVFEIAGTKKCKNLRRQFLKSWRPCIWVILLHPYHQHVECWQCDQMEINQQRKGGHYGKLGPLNHNSYCYVKYVRWWWWWRSPGTCRGRLPLKRRCQRWNLNKLKMTHVWHPFFCFLCFTKVCLYQFFWSSTSILKGKNVLVYA